jgi:hypothetical protein
MLNPFHLLSVPVNKRRQSFFRSYRWGALAQPLFRLNAGRFNEYFTRSSL